MEQGQDEALTDRVSAVSASPEWDAMVAEYGDPLTRPDPRPYEELAASIAVASRPKRRPRNGGRNRRM